MSTLGGDIKSDFTGNNAVKISSTKFEADINSGGNSLILKTSGGDIVVKKNKLLFEVVISNPRLQSGVSIGLLWREIFFNLSPKQKIFL